VRTLLQIILISISPTGLVTINYKVELMSRLLFVSLTLVPATLVAIS
jgi:hypothetical protein